MSFPKKRARFADRHVNEQFDSTLGILNRMFTLDGKGTANSNSASVVESGGGTIFKTVIAISNASASLTNVNSFGVLSFPIYAFPQGAIHILGATANVSVNVNAAADVGKTGSGDFSLGTAAEADETMDGTAVDIIPKTAITDPMVAGVGSGKGLLAAAATFDGTTTAKTINFNFVLDENDLEAASSTGVNVTGTAQVVWINAGDY